MKYHQSWRDGRNKFIQHLIWQERKEKIIVALVLITFFVLMCVAGTSDAYVITHM